MLFILQPTLGYAYDNVMKENNATIAYDSVMQKNATVKITAVRVSKTLVDSKKTLEDNQMQMDVKTGKKTLMGAVILDGVSMVGSWY